jgi:hypothetical protein
MSNQVLSYGDGQSLHNTDGGQCNHTYCCLKSANVDVVRGVDSIMVDAVAVATCHTRHLV